MKDIYDNGEQLIGLCKHLRDYNDRLLNKELIDEDTYKEYQEELEEIDDNAIVMIDYGNGMGDIIRIWELTDKLKEND